MRLQCIAIEAFRGFHGRRHFDLAADSILVYGPNGHGKTSLVEAILWCLTGNLPHLAGRDIVGEEPERNRFAPNGAVVELTLADASGAHVVHRTRSAVSLSLPDGQVLTGTAAEAHLARVLGFSGNKVEPPLFSRTHLLMQSTLAEFILRQRPADRFRWVSQLFGIDACQIVSRRLDQVVRRVGDDAARRQTDLTEARRSVEALIEQERLEQEIVGAGVDPDPLPALANRLAGLQARAVHLHVKGTEALPGVAPQSPEDLARVSSRLSALAKQARTHTHRSQESVRSLILKLSMHKESMQKRLSLVQEQEQLQETEAQAITSLAAAQERLQEAEAEHANWERQRQSVSAHKRNLTQFLQLGRELSRNDRCPLCQQDIQRNLLLKRIEQGLMGVDRHEQSIVQQASVADQKREQRLQTVRQLQGELQAVQRQIRALAGRIAEIEAALDQWRQSVTRLGITASTPDDAEASLQTLESDLGARAAKLEQLDAEIADFSAEVERIRAAGRLAQLRAQLQQATQHEAQVKSHLARERSVGDRAHAMSRAVRQQERELVGAVLDQYKDLFTGLYRRIEPHPLFRQLAFEIQERDERGELYLRVAAGEVGANAAITFSQAQANALGVLLFLGMHLAQAQRSLPFVILDDPMQSLDDVHILGLVDVLQAMAEHRQLMVTTHDAALYNLLTRKMRPLRQGSRVVGYRFSAYSRLGPQVDIDQLDAPEKASYWIVQ